MNTAQLSAYYSLCTSTYTWQGSVMPCHAHVFILGNRHPLLSIMAHAHSMGIGVYYMVCVVCLVFSLLRLSKVPASIQKGVNLVSLLIILLNCNLLNCTRPTPNIILGVWAYTVYRRVYTCTCRNVIVHAEWMSPTRACLSHLITINKVYPRKCG